jgi:hypothetical protein
MKQKPWPPRERQHHHQPAEETSQEILFYGPTLLRQSFLHVIILAKIHASFALARGNKSTHTRNSTTIPTNTTTIQNAALQDHRPDKNPSIGI